jgi:hypothetical protein
LHNIIILPVVLYGCGTWSLTLREEYRLKVFETRMLLLMRIFRTKEEEVTGGWGKLHNDKLRDLCSSPSIIKMIKSRFMSWAGHAARMGENGGKAKS